MSKSRCQQIDNVWTTATLLRTHLLHPPEKLICSCVVPLGFCEQLTQALNRKWNSKIEKRQKIYIRYLPNVIWAIFN